MAKDNNLPAVDPAASGPSVPAQLPPHIPSALEEIMIVAALADEQELLDALPVQYDADDGIREVIAD